MIICCWILLEMKRFQKKKLRDIEDTYFILFYFFLIFCWPCISIYLFININQLDALNFIISLFQAATCFEHMCSKHVEAWNKLIIKFSASSWLILINKHILLSVIFFPRKLWHLWNNVERYATAWQAAHGNIIWRMRIACSINKAKIPHSEYVIRIAFP